MRRLCKIGLDIVQQRAISRSAQQQLLRIIEYRDHIQEDFERMEDHLKEVSKCRSMKENLEFWNLYLHRSYILSELCRPTIRKKPFHGECKELALSLISLCIESLANTVEAFLGLQNITKFASQSWAAMHRSLSSALLLGILGEPAKNERIQKLVSKLATVISDVLTGVDPSELSAPLTRSITALQKLIPQPSGIVDNRNQIALGFGDYFSFDDHAISSVAGSSTAPSPQQISSDEGPSPYSIINSIFWGSIDHSPLS